MDVRADAFHAALRELPILPLDAIAKRAIVVIAPHPDDESLGCGGLIAHVVADGLAVRVIVVSDGTGSHPNSRRFPQAELRRLRESETLAAAHALGLADDAVRFLRLRDTAVPSRGPQADAAIADIAAIAEAVKADAIVTTWRHDPHCDHQAAFDLARAAARACDSARLFSYPVWGWTLPAETMIDVSPPNGMRLDVNPFLARKHAAIAAHKSQTTDLIDDDPAGFRLAPDMLTNFEGRFETFMQETL